MHIFATLFSILLVNIFLLLFIFDKYSIERIFRISFYSFVLTYFIACLILYILKYELTSIDKYAMIISFIILIFRYIRYCNTIFDWAIFLFYLCFIVACVYISVTSLMHDYLDIMTTIWLFTTAYVVINCIKDAYRIFYGRCQRLFLSIAFYILLITLIAAIFIPNTFEQLTNVEFKDLESLSSNALLLKLLMKSIVNNFTLPSIDMTTSGHVDLFLCIQFVLTRVVDCIFLGLIFKFIDSSFKNQ